MRLSALIFLYIMMAASLSSCAIIGPPSEGPPPQRHIQAQENDWQPHPSELDGQAMNIIWNIDSEVRDQLALTQDIKEDLSHHLKERGIQIKNPKDKKTKHLIEEIESRTKSMP